MEKLFFVRCKNDHVAKVNVYCDFDPKLPLDKLDEAEVEVKGEALYYNGKVVIEPQKITVRYCDKHRSLDWCIFTRRK